MKVKFANGTVKTCSAPTEQKIFRTVGGETVGMGWVLVIRLTGNITSSEVDELLVPENVGALEFISETEDGEVNGTFRLNGYNKITSSTIRHSDNPTATYAEIQMSKGV